HSRRQTHAGQPRQARQARCGALTAIRKDLGTRCILCSATQRDSQTQHHAHRHPASHGSTLGPYVLCETLDLDQKFGERDFVVLVVLCWYRHVQSCRLRTINERINVTCWMERAMTASQSTPSF